ncbi:MAG TPA: hypothetical protein VFZ91_15505 [Allosphingosinicella sp.]
MTEKRNITFTEKDNVPTDGITFLDCVFERANLIYDGGAHPRFERCRFSNASWEFSGAALRTVQLLQVINASPGGGAFVASLLGPSALAPRPPARRF